MEISPKEKFFFNALAEFAAGSQEDGNIMLEFCKLIKKSNKLHNLTSIRNLEDMLVKHVLDSLSIRNFLAGRSILDVGAGAGLPSIPLAVICPNKQFSLLDANNKKVIFLNKVYRKLVKALGLTGLLIWLVTQGNGFGIYLVEED